jgi:hypothetical protein
MAGATLKGQVLETLLLTIEPAQTSAALAWSELVTEQALPGAVKLPVKLAEAPGARLAAVKTTVLGEG